MHPLVALPAQFLPSIASWLLNHRHELGEVYQTLARPVTDALAGQGTIDRIGHTLVSVQNGQQEVIGLLHRHTTQLDGLAAGINQVWAGQQVLGRSLDLLTALSAVGLGVSALSHAVLTFQLHALTRRLDRLTREVKELRGMVQADYRGRLTAGLNMFKYGLDCPDDPDRAREHFANAAAALTGSTATFVELLREAVQSPNPAFSWEWARHLEVSALGEAAAHLRTGQKLPAVRAIDHALGPLREHARRVFERTVGPDPARFLIPALAAHGVTLEAVAELYRQAGHAGVVDGPPLSAAERSSPSAGG